MKPSVTKVATVPRTQLVCCPDCCQLVSYDPLQTSVRCQACGTKVVGQTLPAWSDRTASGG